MRLNITSMNVTFNRVGLADKMGVTYTKHLKSSTAIRHSFR